MADFGRHAGGPGGFGVDWDPQGSGTGEELVVTAAADLGQPLEGEANSLANPCAEQDLFTQRGRALVVDFMTAHHPANGVASIGRSDGAPVGNRDLLNPSQVDHIVDVVLLVDVGGQNRDSDLEPVAHGCSSSRDPFHATKVRP